MKTAVVTLSVGRVGAELLDISRPLLKAYAARLGAAWHEFRVGQSVYPVGEKFRLRDAVAYYDRLIFWDADTVVDPARCPDLFELVPADKIGAHDDMAANRRHGLPWEWFQTEHDMLCDSQGWPRVRITAGYNSGVIVASRQHAAVFEPPPRPFPPLYCTEQWSINLRAMRLGFEFFDLPESLNYQWWFRQRMPSRAERPDVHVRHFAGAGNALGHTARLELMRAAVAEIG